MSIADILGANSRISISVMPLCQDIWVLHNYPAAPLTGYDLGPDGSLESEQGCIGIRV